MARAMIAGLLQNGYPTNNIWAGSPNIEKYTPFKNDFEIHITTNNIEAAQKADVIVFAVKPWVAKTICEELSHVIHQKKPFLISLMTGVRTQTLSEFINLNT